MPGSNKKPDETIEGIIIPGSLELPDNMTKLIDSYKEMREKIANSIKFHMSQQTIE